MTNYHFIFSDKPSTRIFRHVVFWVVFSIHFFIQSLLVPGVNEALTPRTPLESLTNVSYFLPVYIISVYIFIELAIPRLLYFNRYALFSIATAGLLVFNFSSCYLSGLLYEHIELKMPYSQITFADNKYHAIVNGGFVSVIILAIAGGIKLSKKWLQKQRENEALAREKINSELQLLKIQINPRFLFHSLHSVKQHILSNSSHSPRLILQVADLLSYILYESDQQYVALSKELAIITDYVNLEENAVAENLQLRIEIEGAVAGKFITPLLLLSVVEAGFEYFLEKTPSEKFSSNLLIRVQEDYLDLKMTYHNLNASSVESIFLLNKKFEGIRKQLHNLYPGDHVFSIESNPENIIILLKKLPLKNYQSPQEDLKVTGNIYENV